MPLLERLAHIATVVATIVALSAFALTSIADSRRADREERKSIRDEVLIGILTEQIQWNERSLAAEFSRRLANLDRDVLERSDGTQETFEATLARLIVAQAASMIDENTVALTNYAETARALDFATSYIEEAQDQLFGRNKTRLAIFQASAGVLTRPEIAKRASHLLPDLNEREIEGLIQSEVDAGFIVNIGTKPNSEELVYRWEGAPPT